MVRDDLLITQNRSYKNIDRYVAWTSNLLRVMQSTYVPTVPFRTRD